MVAYLDQAGVQHLIAKIRNVLWPVGTILATTTNTSPASYIGGSWEAYALGRTLVGASDTDITFGTLEATGGKANWDAGMDTNLSAGIRVDANGNFHVVWNSGYHSASAVNTGMSVDTRAGINWNHKSTAGGIKVAGVYSAMQPYIVVSYWRRTA